MGELFDTAWEREYQAGRALNKYPFDVVVTLTARYFAGVDRAKVHVLDLGSGAGNNAVFFAREGFQVTCLEASPTALTETKRRFAAEGLQGNFLNMRFDELAGFDQEFDFILDRGSLCTTDFADLRDLVVPAVFKLLKPDGIFASWFTSSAHPYRNLCDDLRNGYTYYKLPRGSFGGASRITLLDESGVSQLFGPFRIVQLYHSVRTELMAVEGEPAMGPTAEYLIVCRRG